MNRKVLSATAAMGAATVLFSAAAMAQTPGSTVTPGATGTASTTVTSVVSGTVTVTGTEVMTGTASTTAVASGTSGVSTRVPTTVPVTPVATSIVPGGIYQAGGTGNFPYADPAFKSTWQRTDGPVQSGKVQRTFFWGPGPNTIGLLEAYAQGANGQHLVQYFDKSRMEINNPSATRSNAFFVTNGLLAVDLISGSIQVGDNSFQPFHPACIPMSGDNGDTLAPTYYAFQNVSVNSNRTDTHQAADLTGQKVTSTIDRDGNVGTDPAMSAMTGTNFVHFEPATKHNIPSVFWTFLNSSGPVDNGQGQIVNQQLQQPYFYITGYPVSEPYWAKATIKGQVTNVLIQAYERRALTYVPTNPAGFQVEMANIGQHYFTWRYENAGYCTGPLPPTPGTPVVAPSGTVSPVASGTAMTTGTAVMTGTAMTTGTAVATGTVSPSTTTSVTIVVPTGTVVTATVPSATVSPSVSAVASVTVAPAR